nr:cytochrome b [Propeamussium sp. mt1]
MFYRNSLGLVPLVKGSLYDLPCPGNLSVWWNMGSLLGVCFSIQLVTGWLLSCFYTAHENLAFDSVSFIIREVNSGSFIRNIHINVAGAMFAFMYLHIGRGIYYGSYRLYPVWLSGVGLLLLTMFTAFTGYVLPWGQMSYWAAQVISNFLTVIPYVGEGIAMWFWGGYAVGGITLKRIFSIHFVLPFVIAGVIVLHLGFLHVVGSSNPLGVDSDDGVSVRFHRLFFLKDLVGVVIFLVVLGVCVCFYPYSLVDCETFVPCMYMKTPLNIHPEWYFLFAYSILRSIPNKSGGVVMMLLSILVLLFLPEFSVSFDEGFVRSSFFQLLFWLWVGNFCVLTWIGGKGVVEPYISWGKFCTVMYFLFFLLMPFCGVVDRFIWFSKGYSFSSCG